jgi:kynurenine formamidase
LTRLDGPRHFFPHEGSPWIGEIPLSGGRLVGEGVIVDTAGFVEDNGIYGKDEILASGADGVGEIFPQGDWQIMHRALFPRGVIHVENVGGDVEKVLNRGCAIGCFPLRIESESAPCGVAAFVETIKLSASFPLQFFSARDASRSPINPSRRIP